MAPSSSSPRPSAAILVSGAIAPAWMAVAQFSGLRSSIWMAWQAAFSMGTVEAFEFISATNASVPPLSSTTERLPADSLISWARALAASAGAPSDSGVRRHMATSGGMAERASRSGVSLASPCTRVAKSESTAARGGRLSGWAGGGVGSLAGA